MKPVKVYQIEEIDILVFDTQEFYETYSHSSFSSLGITEEFKVIGEIVAEKTHLPIKTYRWSDGKTIHAVMSNELREIIGIEVDEIDHLKSENYHKHLLIKQLEGEIHEYENLSFWQRLKFLFKGKKNDISRIL